VLFYHYVVIELRSAGMPEEKLFRLKGEERLREALPYFNRIRNTSTFWCLRQILSELYGIDVNSIDYGNYREVMEELESTKGDQGRALKILKLNVDRSLPTLTLWKKYPASTETFSEELSGLTNWYRRSPGKSSGGCRGSLGSQ
jgi:hypothetical protein